MPWHIEEQDGQYCVIKDDSGESGGCHDTRNEAEDQMAALYANEPEERMNENILKRFFDHLKGFFDELGKAERALSLSRLYHQVDSLLYQSSEGYPWLVDVYMDEGQTYAVSAEDGKLYRYDVMVDGEDVALGERVQITEIHAPVSRTTVTRQEDGRYRWFSISATSTLNRVGEIDSQELFDNFVRHAEETGQYPYRTFFHKGEQFRVGQADFLARDGNCYITSGLYDADNELAEAEIRARQADPDYWGESIGYDPIGEPEMVEIGGATIPVYRDGIHEEISTLPETRAASWFTISKIQEVNRMLKDVEFEAFVRLFDGDEDKARSWLEGNVDETNREIAERQMVTRSDNEPDASPPAGSTEPEPDEEAQDEQPLEREVELDDEMLETVVRAVAESEDVQALMTPVQDDLKTLQEAVEKLTRSLESVRGGVDSLDGRVADLEKDDDEKRREWTADLPRRQTVRVTHRPREANANGGAEPSIAERADAIAWPE